MTTEKIETTCANEAVSLRDLPEDIMRVNQTPLTAIAVDGIKRVKMLGNNFHAFLDTFTKTRELSLSKTKLEECVMWAVKGISA